MIFKFNDSSTADLDSTHMALRFPEYAYPYGNMLWMDPGATRIREHTLHVADDILRR